MGNVSKRRKIVFKEYEVLEFKPTSTTQKYKYKINNEKYNGYYSIDEMAEFEECSITRAQLARRIVSINNQDGNCLDLWSAITNKSKEKK